jgi:hypothetical protein
VLDDKAGLVPNSRWAFCPTAGGKKAHTGDYHKVFNSTNFIVWWKTQLLRNLNQPSLIMMDNAAYHKTYPSTIPKVARMKRAEVVAYLEGKSIVYDPKDTVNVLKQNIRTYITDHEMRECELLAEEQGHKVLFTPAEHILPYLYPANTIVSSKDHTTMTAPLPVCSAKLSIVGPG